MEARASALSAAITTAFFFSDYGTEITCDGEFLCEISHDWELEELLMDLSGS